MTAPPGSDGDETVRVGSSRTGHPSSAVGGTEPGSGDLTGRTEIDAATIEESTAASIVESGAVRDERRRTRLAGLWVSAVVCVLAAVVMQLGAYRAPAHWLLTAAFGATALVACGFIVAVRRGHAGSASSAPFSVGIMLSLTAVAAVAYVGLLSLIGSALVLLVYYYSLGDSVFRARVIYGICAGGYFLLAVATLAGYLSVTESAHALAEYRPRGVVLSTFLLEAFLAGTYWLGRRSRLATVEAMAALETARRQIQQRDALLQEARADYERFVDAGKIGRFTGAEVGPYAAHEIIGRGGMGEVYAAAHRDTGGRVALKVLHPHLVGQPEQTQRFFREAEVSGSLESEHIVKTLGSGHAADGSPYLAMELLSGRDLADVLRSEKRLPPSQVLRLVVEVGEALAKAQEAGIVHRDIKPQNVFLAETRGREIWKVLDFGVSKMAGVVLTATDGVAIGTPSYMSPEQARGRPVPHRSDVFSLAVIAYRALTGRPAFTAPDQMATIYQVVHVQPTKPSDLVDCGEDVDLVLALGLAKERERRLRSATSFAAAFRDATRHELDDRFREAARAILLEHPWGAERMTGDA